MARYVLAKATYSKIVFKLNCTVLIAYASGSRSRGDHRYIDQASLRGIEEYRVGFNLNHIISEQVQIASLASRRKLASIKFCQTFLIVQLIAPTCYLSFQSEFPLLVVESMIPSI
jgi:hypothetical protein